MITAPGAIFVAMGLLLLLLLLLLLPLFLYASLLTPAGLRTTEWTSATGELHRHSFTFEDGVKFCLKFSAHPNPLDDGGVVQFANEATVEAQRPGEKAYTNG